MCNRFTLRTPLSVLVERYMAELVAQIPKGPEFNIAPTNEVAVVRINGPTRALNYLKWGLIPSWSKEGKTNYSTTIARADSVASKPAYRNAYKQRRCLILADGYFEWVEKNKVKLPYFFEVDEGAPFTFAGIWERWQNPKDASEAIESCALITTDPNTLASRYADRMPVILEPSAHGRWLDPRLSNPADLLRPFPAERMQVRPVSTFVNNSRNKGPECIADRVEPILP